MTKRACVIGFPIAHSRSPIIHQYWLRQLGIDGTYEKREVRPEDIESFIRGLPGSVYAGCNVTLPHKEAVIEVLDHVTTKARRLRSVNTVYVRNGQTFGTSTDGEGFVENVHATIKDFSVAGCNAVILGAGGSASAIVGELIDRQCNSVTIVNRTRSKADLLAQRFGQRVRSSEDRSSALRNCDLLINTTSQGMNNSAGPDVTLELLPPSAIVCDIIYVPLQTALIKNAQQRGLRTVTGLGMLLHQAVAGFELWFGVRPKVTQELFDIVIRDIEAGA